MRNGERQVAADINGIRRDHSARYYWAVNLLTKKCLNGRVIDVACGIGYGSKILAEAGFTVTAIDNDQDAIAYAKRHYDHPNITYRVADAEMLGNLSPHDAAISFETIEHLRQPRGLLAAVRCAPLLLASVPNEEKFPWRRHKFHFRHYTKREFADLLAMEGFASRAWWGQEGPQSEVVKNINGRTLIVVAQRKNAAEIVKLETRNKRKAIDLPFLPPPDGPKSVAILGLGPTLLDYVSMTTKLGSRKKLCDEAWGINAVADVVQCDLSFHMDDTRIQSIRADANPTGNIAAMLPWLKKHPGPIFTSRTHPDYPGMVEYPLQDVLNACDNQRYCNSTAAAAVMYAIYRGVKKIYSFGIDFSSKSSHQAEMGRACYEFWLGYARAKGIELAMPKRTSLMDACEPAERRFYGYDTLKIDISGHDGAEIVKFTPRPESEWPTAEEIEDRYDHRKPTVPPHLRQDNE